MSQCNQMMFSFYAFWTLVTLNLLAFGLSAYAHRRVAITDKALKELDWETIVSLTGEVGAIKRSLQKTNNRINGMTSSDPAAMLAALPQMQQAQQVENGKFRGG